MICIHKRHAQLMPQTDQAPGAEGRYRLKPGQDEPLGRKRFRAALLLAYSGGKKQVLKAKEEYTEEEQEAVRLAAEEGCLNHLSLGHVAVVVALVSLCIML